MLTMIQRVGLRTKDGNLYRLVPADPGSRFDFFARFFLCFRLFFLQVLPLQLRAFIRVNLRRL